MPSSTSSLEFSKTSSTSVRAMAPAMRARTRLASEFQHERAVVQARMAPAVAGERQLGVVIERERAAVGKAELRAAAGATAQHGTRRNRGAHAGRGTGGALRIANLECR